MKFRRMYSSSSALVCGGSVAAELSRLVRSGQRGVGGAAVDAAAPPPAGRRVGLGGVVWAIRSPSESRRLRESTRLDMKCRRRGSRKAGRAARSFPHAAGRSRGARGPPPGAAAHPVRAEPDRLSPSRPRRQRGLGLGSRPRARRAGPAPARGPRPGPVPAGVRGGAARRPRVAGPRARRRAPAELRAGRSPYRQSDAGEAYQAASPRCGSGVSSPATAPGRTSPASRATSSTRRRATPVAAVPAGSPPAPARGLRLRLEPAVERFDGRPAGRRRSRTRRSSAATSSCATAWGTGPISSRWWWTTSGRASTGGARRGPARSSTGRQIRARPAASAGRAPPVFLHHPLIRKPGGEKLSKSSGDTGIRELRGGAALRRRTALGRAARLDRAAAGAEPIAGRTDLAKLFGAG